MQTKTLYQKEWFEQLDKEPEEKEWYNVIKQTNNKSAPENSEIGYRFIKKTPMKMHNILRKFAQLCYWKLHIKFKGCERDNVYLF